MTHTLITGAESGLGLAMTRVFIDAGSTVAALCRESSPALDALAPDIHEGVDVTNAATVYRAAAEMGDKTIDVLINNAGIMIEDHIDRIDIAAVRGQFEVNALGPLSMALAFRKRFRRGSRMVNISSRLGSMEDNDSGEDYGYRMSKAAQNMLTSNLSIDLAKEDVIVVALHPGIVATGMTGGKGTPTDEVARDLKAVIDTLDASQSGQFLDRFGSQIPW
jgi:NAD(P)-dependent dehydrogenase (short-subunit alcohol dehydrogenase family)